MRAGKQVWPGTSKVSTSDVAGADTQLLGWESLTYGDLRPTVSLAYETRSQLPVRFATIVLTDERCKLESRDGQLVILRDESEIYRVDFSAKEAGAVGTEPFATSVPKA